MAIDMTTAPLLRLEDLHTDIDVRNGVVHALSGVNLEVRQGETLGIVGESGCGKTMTALSVMGLLPQGGHVSKGKILFDGKDLTAMSDREVMKIRGTDIGMIFQDPLTSLNPTMKIGLQVGESLRVHQGASKKEARAAAIDMLARVGMPRADKIVDDYPHQLSGGMRQRAMIAMALVSRPKLLIADEPTTALDVTTQRQILELIDDLREEFNMAVILITHDLGVVAGRTDRVAVMYAGRVAETAKTRDVFDHPRHQYTSALLAALPENAITTRKELYTIPGAPPPLNREMVGCPFAPRCTAATEQCHTERPRLRDKDGQPARSSSESHVWACFHPADGALRIEGLRDLVINEPDPLATPLVEVRDVSKRFTAYGGGVIRKKIGYVSAVDHVSFSIPAGTTYGLVGESGCGKSTIGRIIAGLDAPTSGEVALNGRNIHGMKGHEAKKVHADVQMMFQDSYAAMDPRMRVDEILQEPMIIQHTGSRVVRAERIEDILKSVGLAKGVLSRYPHEFSGGQLQRIGFARSLTLKPDLIVADEPVSALDVSVQAQVLNLMRQLQVDLGLAYLFISHDLSVVQYMSDRIGVMYLGKLVEEGPANEIVENPRHPYTQALINAIPSTNPERNTDASLTVEGELPSAINPPSGCRFRTRCPFATEKCTTEPAFVTCDEDGHHKVACHFPIGTPAPAAAAAPAAV